MKPQLRFAAAAVLALALAIAAAPQQKLPRAIENPDITLPDGKSQQDEILKADHERDLKDAAQLIELSEQLKAELRMPLLKQQITLRLDPDVIDWFKRTGKGYQSRMGAVLRSYVEAKRKRSA